MNKYDLAFQKAYLSRQTGVITCACGDVSTGREFLEQALAVYAELGQAAFGKKLTEQALKKYAARSSGR